MLKWVGRKETVKAGDHESLDHSCCAISAMDYHECTQAICRVRSESMRTGASKMQVKHLHGSGINHIICDSADIN